MGLLGFDDLHSEIDSLRPRVPVVAAGGAEASVLEALAHAFTRGWIDPIVVGRSDEIGLVAEQAGIDLGGFRMVEAEAGDEGRLAVAEVRGGRASILVKGRVSTPDLMEAILEPELGLRNHRTICQVVMMELLDTKRRFLLADTGVCIKPGYARKREILEALVDLAHALGEPEPKVALLAATEKVVATMPETVDAHEMTRRNQAGDPPGCRVQGPLSFDLAFAADAGDKKRVEGPVVGLADALLFPNLLSANLTVKAIMYTARCRFGGLLRGTSHPVAFMSRSDTAGTRLNSLALALRVLDRSYRDRSDTSGTATHRSNQDAR